MKKHLILLIVVLLSVSLLAVPVSAETLDNSSEQLSFSVEQTAPSLNGAPGGLSGFAAEYTAPTLKASSDIVNCTIYGTYDYARAQELYGLINSSRSGSSLNSLTLDPTLTEMAMLRAAEIAVYYNGDTRPDGSDWETLYSSNSSYSSGQFAYYGSAKSTASAVLTVMENDSSDIVTNSACKSVGIGCYYQDDTLFWFILGCNLTVDTSATPTEAEYQNSIPIAIHKDYRSWTTFDSFLTDDSEYFYLYNECTTQPIVKLENTGISADFYIALSGGYSITSEDTSVVTTADMTITAVGTGETTVKVVFDNAYYTLPYKVINRASLSYSLNSSSKPVITCTNEGEALLYYKGASDSSWTETSVSSGTFTHSSATPGETYSYRIRYKNNQGKWVAASDLLKVTVPGNLTAPQVVISNVASTGKIKLTWDAVDGAAKYEVYRATSKSGTYTLLKTVTGTKLTNTSTTAGKTYYYYVIAVAEDGTKSSKSEIVSRTCDCARPEVTATNVASTGKIKLSWDAVDGAAKYEVYRATSKSGTYTLLKTVTGTKLTNTSTTAGKTYYYKVKAIGSKDAANSAYSTVVGRTCDLPRPSVSITLNSSGKPKLTWDAVDGAVEYEVYRATSKNGTYSLLKTVTGTSIVNSSVTAGKIYYYKVIAVASKEAANSAYSAVKFISSTSVSISDSKTAKSVITQINKYRADQGLSELEWYSDGTMAARIRAAELTKSFSSTTRPDGYSPDALWAAYGLNAECIAKGFSSASSVVSAWMSNSSTSKICLSKDYTYAVAARNGDYWIVLFG